MDSTAHPRTARILLAGLLAGLCVNVVDILGGLVGSAVVDRPTSPGTAT